MRAFELQHRGWIAFAIALAGCTKQQDEPSPPPLGNIKSLLIHNESREHHFGIVIGGRNRRLTHRYHLANATGHNVKIVDIINRKPCCGVIHAEKTELGLGDETDVEVTLVVGDTFGDVVHETEIITDIRPDESVLLRTAATAVPSIQVEGLTLPEGPMLQGDSRPFQAEFRVLASGTTSDPPVDLDGFTIQSDIPVEWLGTKEKQSFDDGLQVESRRFSAFRVDRRGWTSQGRDPPSGRTEFSPSPCRRLGSRLAGQCFSQGHLIQGRLGEGSASRDPRISRPSIISHHPG